MARPKSLPTDGWIDAMGVQSDMPRRALARYGSHELKKQYLNRPFTRHGVQHRGDEASGGSDVASETERQGDDYVITAQDVHHHGRAGRLDLPVGPHLAGARPTGMSLIIVPTDAPGFSVSKKLRRWVTGPATRPS